MTVVELEILFAHFKNTEVNGWCAVRKIQDLLLDMRNATVLEEATPKSRKSRVKKIIEEIV